MRIIGWILASICGIGLYLFEIVWLHRWWGTPGLLVGIFVPPVALVFPFVYLVKVGFSGLYFGLWALAVIGLVLVRITWHD